MISRYKALLQFLTGFLCDSLVASLSSIAQQPTPANNPGTPDSTTAVPNGVKDGQASTDRQRRRQNKLEQKPEPPTIASSRCCPITVRFAPANLFPALSSGQKLKLATASASIGPGIPSTELWRRSHRPRTSQVLGTGMGRLREALRRLVCRQHHWHVHDFGYLSQPAP